MAGSECEPLLDASNNFIRIEEKGEELETQLMLVYVAQGNGQTRIEKTTDKPVACSVVEVPCNVEWPIENKIMDEAGVRYVFESQNGDERVPDLKKCEDYTNPMEISTSLIVTEDEMKPISEDGYATASNGSRLHERFKSIRDVNGSHEQELERAPGQVENDIERTTSFDGSEKCVDSLIENKEKEGIMDNNVEFVSPVSNDTYYGSMNDGGVKCSRRRRKAKKSCVEVDEKNDELIFVDGILVVCEKKGEGSKRRYSRTEMEAIGFGNHAEQQMRWNEIYQGFPPAVARELDQIFVSKCEKQLLRKVDQKKQKKYKLASVICEASIDNMEESLGEGHTNDLADNDYFDGVNEAVTVVEEICGEDEGSDDEDDKIQRPAFYVEGDPDFESGPPQDGLEYLRRVRWEAAQIPKVKVAKVCSTKPNKEQTPYMPSIPEIEPCPQHLMPSEQWEKSFLEDFSLLRLVLSELEISRDNHLHLAPPVSSGEEACKADIDVLAKSKNVPTLSSILKMDVISRASKLRNHIGLFETANTLSRDNCLWIFSLCAVLDTPLDADMSASFRFLLRKCSSLRAKRLEYDDEVVMLNMLVTIAGKYFGQAEC
ncbi:uncharacterized protein [Aristolochia californica]|uniref:uncharacterized protein n=1 Tax=Aristolochia californica TaxID=171875 RepID=UPI0035E329B5